MNITSLNSRAARGVDAVPVRVETHLAPGLPGFTIVGNKRPSRVLIRARTY
ncbi:hypothetical protein MLD55_01540 [Alcanivorax sp. MM125-6]|nr:hypothetical protein [Alcanivorax sp. MM125-6]